MVRKTVLITLKKKTIPVGSILLHWIWL